jgi:hypothetical protein
MRPMTGRHHHLAHWRLPLWAEFATDFTDEYFGGSSSATAAAE